MTRTIATAIVSAITPVRRLLQHACQYWQGRYQQRQTRHILNSLTDHQLKDIGLTRETIQLRYSNGAKRARASAIVNHHTICQTSLNHKADCRNSDR
ncbi:DUF1127 domain-containing protein [Dickeya lacustris]